MKSLAPTGAIALERPGAAARADAPAFPEIVFWGLPALLLIDYLGLAYQWPVLRVTRVATLLAWGMFAAVVASGGFRIGGASRQGRLLLGLLGLAAASVLYAVVRSYVPTNVRFQADYFALFIVTASLVDRRARVKKLALAGTLIVIVLVARNLDGLTSGLRVGSFRAGSFMGDGNDFAWGLITLMPLPLFLALGRNGVFVRLFGWVGMAMALFGVVGTQSRGATLAIVAAALYYWFLQSKRRILGVVVLAVAVVAATNFAPEGYVDRVTTTDVENDTSAQGRLRAWRAAIQMAMDYPLGVGAGNFNSAYGRFYMPEDDGSYASRRWISAHSIYFKVLGESGLPGLVLLIAVLATNFRDLRRTRQFIRDHPNRTEIEDRWPAALSFGLVGYAVAGAFLGGIAYPHLYLLSGLVVACRRLTLDRGVEPTPAVTQPDRRMPIHPMLAPPQRHLYPRTRPHARV